MYFFITFTKKLLPFFNKITVIEAASELIERAKKNVVNPTIQFIHSTFEAYQTLQCFDAIFLIHTLEHLTDPILVLKKIRQWLMPTGRFFVAVPNATALSRQIATHMGLIDHCAAVTTGERQHGHQVTYTLDLLLHQLALAKFKVIQFGGTMLKPFSGAQFDQLIDHKIINQNYLDACYKLGKIYPELAGSIYAICEQE